jgi:UDP-N-acetylmuramate dehydrogenase
LVLIFTESKTTKILAKRAYLYVIVSMIYYKNDISLLPYNTFGINVNAAHLFFLRTPESLREILALPDFSDMSHNMTDLLVLGGGSNVLFTHDFKGVVIKNEIKGIRILKEDKKFVFLEAGSGETWQDLVDFAVGKKLAGIENLTLIPGTVGAAPVQNIGAYGVEAADVIDSVRAFHLEKKEWMTLDNRECEFGYRDSIFKRELKNRVVNCSVVFRLSKTRDLRLDYGGIREELDKRNVSGPTLEDISTIVAGIRRSKLPDPAILGNAGSFFKNPLLDESEFQVLSGSFPMLKSYRQGDLYKISAGWLIEQAGWKGYRSGDAGCYDKQALILVNYGNAKGEDVLALSEKIQKSVFYKFGITLEREVNLIS